MNEGAVGIAFTDDLQQVRSGALQSQIAEGEVAAGCAHEHLHCGSGAHRIALDDDFGSVARLAGQRDIRRADIQHRVARVSAVGQRYDAIAAPTVRGVDGILQLGDVADVDCSLCMSSLAQSEREAREQDEGSRKIAGRFIRHLYLL